MTSRPVLNIIGTGKLGTTVGRLAADNNLAAIGAIYSRNPSKLASAEAFIGQGSPCQYLDEMDTADLWLISTSDDAIANIALELATGPQRWSNCTVFHCSGIHTSRILAPLANLGADTGSIHPAHSFANPVESLRTFAGSYCTVEGDDTAVTTLSALFTALGARIARISPDTKSLYHAATAIASNHLVALIDSCYHILAASGLDPEQAHGILAPLATNTCNNIFNFGTEAALTGPISRGDSGTVASHLQALAARCPDETEGYLALGRLALRLATQEKASPGHREISDLFNRAIAKSRME